MIFAACCEPPLPEQQPPDVVILRFETSRHSPRPAKRVSALSNALSQAHLVQSTLQPPKKEIPPCPTSTSLTVST